MGDGTARRLLGEQSHCQQWRCDRFSHLVRARRLWLCALALFQQAFVPHAAFARLGHSIRDTYHPHLLYDARAKPVKHVLGDDYSASRARSAIRHLARPQLYRESAARTVRCRRARRLQRVESLLACGAPADASRSSRRRYLSSHLELESIPLAACRRSRPQYTYITPDARLFHRTLQYRLWATLRGGAHALFTYSRLLHSLSPPNPERPPNRSIELLTSSRMSFRAVVARNLDCESTQIILNLSRRFAPIRGSFLITE